MSFEVKYEQMPEVPDPLLDPADGDPESLSDLPRFPVDLPEFEIEAELGRGGMGVVYRARQRTLRRVVALKTIMPGRLRSEAAVERFRREAEAAGMLSHPCIVPIFEYGEAGDMHFFTMGLVDGESLASRLQEGPVPEREAVRIVLDVARAIQYAHDQGVIHRDLKPANILLDRSGAPRITDFGLAKTLGDLDGPTISGDMLGTPSYMPPEQVTGNAAAIGPRSDVWGLGATLYALLTGRPPFVGGSVLEVVRQVMERDPVGVRVLLPTISRDLELIVGKCLQKPIDLRYETAGALADDLEAFLDGRSISAASAHFGDLVARWLGEAPQGYVLRYWGPLWVIQGAFLFAMMSTAQFMLWSGVTSRTSYIAVVVLSFVAWSPIFMALRRRRGPITHAERQLAHIWGACILSIGGIMVAEWALGLEVLTLAPLILVVGAGQCFMTAAILSGSFYFHTAAHLIGAALAVLLPQVKVLLIAIISGASFIIPGARNLKSSRMPAETVSSADSFHVSVDSRD